MSLFGRVGWIFEEAGMQFVFSTPQIVRRVPYTSMRTKTKRGVTSRTKGRNYHRLQRFSSTRVAEKKTYYQCNSSGLYPPFRFIPPLRNERRITGLRDIGIRQCSTSVLTFFGREAAEKIEIF